MSPSVPASLDPVKVEAAKRQKQKAEALKELEAWTGQGLNLSRRVFFVPGWAGEEGKCWIAPYQPSRKGHRPIKEWLGAIVRNPGHVTYIHYLRFTEKESQSCPTFLEFAELVKAKIGEQVAKDEPIDLIGHSMGGLDMTASLTVGQAPLANPVVNCVAVGSPLRGVAYGNLVDRIKMLIPNLAWLPHHFTQLKNMDHGAGAIRLVNQLQMRRLLMERVRMFYGIFGTQDTVVGRNAQLRTEGLTEEQKRRVVNRFVEGATHTGVAGITQDPRTAVLLVHILAGLSIAANKGNQGFLIGGS
ncbi:MAG: hypothetical protein HYU33_02150 [Candidatus Omnitrophica bacterium]|nr:hypothetical protein [Candidatus Omnitrophota bacterium]